MKPLKTYAELKDRLANTLRIIDCDLGPPSVWITCSGVWDDPSAIHLNIDQAKELRRGLDAFIREHEPVRMVGPFVLPTW